MAKKVSDETRAKMSAARKARKTQPATGLKHTQEAKKRIGAAQAGKIHSTEHRKKIGAARMGNRLQKKLSAKAKVKAGNIRKKQPAKTTKKTHSNKHYMGA